MSELLSHRQPRFTRGLLLAAVLATGTAGALVAAPVAGAYPAYTCGRARGYVVRSHGPSCSFALRWTSRYLSRHRSPHGYRCRSYGANAPVYCTATRLHHGSGDRKYYYFFAAAS
ncbi:MAG: hypothetical protein E6G56_08320 [Actinobacteria bacterium]|nr:MAG: hypothetical protein E6G56_08320 [Actinomycetota bacterium]